MNSQKNFDRRSLLKNSALGAGAVLLGASNLDSANAASITWWQDPKQDSFWLQANNAPAGSYLVTTWFINGVKKSKTVYTNNWWSDIQTGWSNAQGKLYSSRGKLLSTGPVFNPPVVATPEPTPSSMAPYPAALVGMKTLGLETVFDSQEKLKTIDLYDTRGPGYTWYTTAPWGHAPTSDANSFKINSDSTGSYLTISPNSNQANWNLSSFCPEPKDGRYNGKYFTHGYFEASLRFEPRDDSTINFNDPAAWPSFWGASVTNYTDPSTTHTGGELDYMEALAGKYNTSVGWHEWNPSSIRNGEHWSNGAHPATSMVNNGAPLDFGQWQTYGCAWVTTGNNEGYANFYINNQWVYGTTWSSTNGPTPTDGIALNYKDNPNWPKDVFTIMAHDQQCVVLGTGAGWPLDVQWVRVWQY